MSYFFKIAQKRRKIILNYFNALKTISLKHSPGCSQEVVVYERFQPGKNLFLVGGRLWEVALTKCGYTWRFDSSFKKLSN